MVTFLLVVIVLFVVGNIATVFFPPEDVAGVIISLTAIAMAVKFFTA